MLQEAQIKQGHSLIFDRHDQVQSVILECNEECRLSQEQAAALASRLAELATVEAGLEEERALKEREWAKRIELEKSLLERGKEFILGEQAQIEEWRKRREQARVKKRAVPDEIIKLRNELEKVTRDNNLLGIIAENYEKEIARRNIVVNSSHVIKPSSEAEQRP
jgi:hypothetical protein